MRAPGGAAPRRRLEEVARGPQSDPFLPARVLGRQRHGALRAGGLLRPELGPRGLPDREPSFRRARIRRAGGRLPPGDRVRGDLRRSDTRRGPRGSVRLPPHAPGRFLAALRRVLRRRRRVDLRHGVPVSPPDGHRRRLVQADHLGDDRAVHRRAHLHLRLRHLLLDDQPRRVPGAACRHPAQGVFLARGLHRVGRVHRADALTDGFSLPRPAPAGESQAAPGSAARRRGGARRRPVHADDRRVLRVLDPVLPELRLGPLVPEGLRRQGADQPSGDRPALRGAACPGGSRSTPSTSPSSMPG